MSCDELKIGACRNGVMLALASVLLLGPIVCSAQAALPQKQEAVARTPEEHSALNILTKAHPDWMVLRETPEYNQWLNSKSADFRQTFEGTWDANVVSKGLTEFKSWRDTTRQEAALLKKVKAGEKTPSADELQPWERDYARTPTGLFDDVLDKPKEAIPPSSLLGATGILALSVLLAFCCAYILWTVLGKSVKGSTPLATGRRWMNWVVVAACLQPLTKFFSQLLGGFGNPGNVLAQGVAGTVVLALIAFGLGALWAYFRKRKSNSAGVSITSTATATFEHSARMTDNQSFAAASEEVESGKIDKGLWARLYAETDGDEAKTKARYIKFRASQIDVSPAA